MVKKIKIEKEGYECSRCSYRWIPKKLSEPVVCPKCKSPYWKIEKKKEFTKKNLKITHKVEAYEK